MTAYITYLQNIADEHHELREGIISDLRAYYESQSKHAASPVVSTPLYASFMEVYFEWHQQAKGIKPRISAGDGKALKSIIKYMEEQDKEAALDNWKLILSNFDKLNDFLRSQTQLTQINKNLVEIIIKLKSYVQQQQPAKAASIAERFQRR